MNSTDSEYMREMNEYFNKLGKCSLNFKHHKGECCYVGTVGERYAKFKEIKEKGDLEKRKEMDKLIENNITRKNKHIVLITD